jgi:hypothetical protein
VNVTGPAGTVLGVGLKKSFPTVIVVLEPPPPSEEVELLQPASATAKARTIWYVRHMTCFPCDDWWLVGAESHEAVHGFVAAGTIPPQPGRVSRSRRSVAVGANLRRL